MGIEDAEVIRLASGLMSAAPPPTRPTGPRRRLAIVPVRRSDADQAGGEEIVRRAIEAVASADDPALRAKAADVVAALKAIGPKTPVESGLAGLFVAMERAAFDCLAIARIAAFDSPMGMVMLGRAEKLAVRAAELADALARQRTRGQQRIVVQHIHGGQAVGMVNQGEGGRSG